mmetsp:Transcript_21492/g.35457  ORF Transcript_21492/g.35457 Transcript_21492/m.35457 type:complete len:81 (-) Transcript_21492:130-372(-)
MTTWLHGNVHIQNCARANCVHACVCERCCFLVLILVLVLVHIQVQVLVPMNAPLLPSAVPVPELVPMRACDCARLRVDWW